MPGSDGGDGAHFNQALCNVHVRRGSHLRQGGARHAKGRHLCRLAGSSGNHPRGLCRSHRSLFQLEASPAKHRTTLRRFERDGRLDTAYRTIGTRFRADYTRLVTPAALDFTGLAPFGIVLEIAIGEEQLLPCREDKVFSAIGTTQNPVDKLHTASPTRGKDGTKR